MFHRRGRGTNGESEKALADAQEHLATVQNRGQEVTEVSTGLRKIRERNHFAEQLHLLISGHEMKGGRHAS